MDEHRTESAVRSGTQLPLADSPDEASFGGEVPDPEILFASAGRPAEPAPAAPASGDLPSIVLAVAGLAVFDSIIVVVFLSLWAINPDAMLAVIQTMAGIALLLAVAPIVIGGMVLHTNKQSGTVMPGTPWAGVGILVGIILAGLTLLIPLMTAVRLLLGSPLDPSVG